MSTASMANPPASELEWKPTRPIMAAAELARHTIDRHGRNYAESDDGYGDMEAEKQRGWKVIAGWGRDGWDLGDWPYVAIYTRDTDDEYDLLQIVEGDRTAYRFSSEADREAAIDYLFVWYALGRDYKEWIQAGLTTDKREELNAGTLLVPEELRGPVRF